MRFIGQHCTSIQWCLPMSDDEEIGSPCVCGCENFERVIVGRVVDRPVITDLLACVECRCVYYSPLPRPAPHYRAKDRRCPRVSSQSTRPPEVMGRVVGSYREHRAGQDLQRIRDASARARTGPSQSGSGLGNPGQDPTTLMEQQPAKATRRSVRGGAVISWAPGRFRHRLDRFLGRRHLRFDWASSNDSGRGRDNGSGSGSDSGSGSGSLSLDEFFGLRTRLEVEVGNEEDGGDDPAESPRQPPALSSADWSQFDNQFFGQRLGCAPRASSARLWPSASWSPTSDESRWRCDLGWVLLSLRDMLKQALQARPEVLVKGIDPVRAGEEVLKLFGEFNLFQSKGNIRRR